MSGPSDEGVYPKSRREGGLDFIYYALRFNEQGTCVSPKTREQLVEDVRNGGYSDVFVFSHGWNNNWYDAGGRALHEVHRELPPHRGR